MKIARLKEDDPRVRILFSLAGALAFLLVFALAYSRIPAENYKVRDDGVITLSHAKNWVDYGFIGVGPSGERVEGYSAPAQFFLYALVYAVSGIDYEAYAKLQTWAFTLILGFLFLHFLPGGRTRGLIIALLAAVLLTRRASFLEWHGSGLENAITHALFLATVGILAGFIDVGRIVRPLAIVPFLAAISRLDSIVHIAPILVLFAILWRIWHKNLKGAAFAAIALCLWGAFQLWRVAYFGDILPNTAYGQGISVTERLRELVGLNKVFLTSGMWLSNRILAAHGGAVLLPFLILLPFTRRDRRSLFLLLATACFAVTAYAHPFLFGRTTLDPARATTHVALFAVLAMAHLAGGVANGKKLAISMLVVLPLAFFAERATVLEPGYLCCSVEPFESIRLELRRLGLSEDLPRPTIANPDLGAVSWHKDFNVIDLGGLGSPIVAKLRHGPLLADYILEHAAPDLIESHGAWSERYFSSLFGDPRFARLYDRAEDLTIPAPRKGDRPIVSEFWIRREIRKASPGAERRLIEDLRDTLSVERLARELDLCRRAGRSSTYVARCAYRFLPEIVAAGEYDEVKRLFAAGEPDGFARYLIEGRDRPRAYRRALELIADRYLEKTLGKAGQRPEPILDSGYRVYRAGQDLVYLKEGRSGGSVNSWFFLDLFPADERRKPEHIELSFREARYEIGDRCLVVYRLPSYPIRAIRTGEFLRGGATLWEGTAVLDSVGAGR